MQLTFEPARLTGFAIFAVAAATVLSVGACSSSHDEKSPATSSPAAAKGKAEVRGLVASVSGNAVQVTAASGTATVDVSPSTKVTETTVAQLSDIAAGNCVSVDIAAPAPGGPVIAAPAPGGPVTAAPAPGGPVTAASVHFGLPGGDGKCAQPKAGPRKVIGTVASVAGNTINVTVTDANGNPAQTAVTVTNTTKYSKGAAATLQAIAQGKCIDARGTKDDGGTLQATVVRVGPAHDGKCPQPAATHKK